MHVLASQLRQQQQEMTAETSPPLQPLPDDSITAAEALSIDGIGHNDIPHQQMHQRLPPSGLPRNAVEVATVTAAVPPPLTHGSLSCPMVAPPPSMVLRPPADSSGRGQGLDLGHLSFTCVTAAPLSDDFLGELLRQTTAGQAAAEVTAAAAAAAALRASRCIAAGREGCMGTCIEAAAVAAAAADAAAAAAAAVSDYASWGGLEGREVVEEEDEEERELFDVVIEELQAVEEAAVEAEREVEEEMELEMRECETCSTVGDSVGNRGGGGPNLPRVKKEKEGKEAVVSESIGNGAAEAPGLHPNSHNEYNNNQQHHHHLKGAFSHRMQLLPGVFYSYYIGSQAFTNTAVSCVPPRGGGAGGKFVGVGWGGRTKTKLAPHGVGWGGVAVGGLRRVIPALLAMAD